MLGLFTILLVVAQFRLPRHWAFAPLLIAVCNLPNMPVLDVGVTFTPAKFVIMAGLIRAATESRAGQPKERALDILILVWGIWAILSAIGHNPPDHNPLTVRLSLVYDIAGSYVYTRSFVRSREDWLRFVKCLGAVQIPLAALMAVEKATGYSLAFSLASGSPIEAVVRGGRVRATGPFSHPILAGTVAATTAVLMPILIKDIQTRRLGWLYFGACIVTIFCSASSGPILAFMAGMSALMLWKRRALVRRIWIAGLVSLFCLHLVMNAPVWYLLQRIDLVGGSTGNHRAELITQAIEHFSDWWLVGTDYTRDWLPYGVEWSPNNIDITNYYIRMGVTGGILLMMLFAAILIRSFGLLGREMRALRRTGDPDEYRLWCLGVSLFAHCVAFVSISYFDQSNIVPFWLIGALQGMSRKPSLPRRVATGLSPSHLTRIESSADTEDGVVARYSAAEGDNFPRCQPDIVQE